jgi:hypothetical protein
MASSSTTLPFIPADSPLVDALVEAAKPRSDDTKEGAFYALLATSRPAIAELVELLVWASTEPEEGRAVKGTVVLADSMRPDVGLFDHPTPVDARGLVQLLTAFSAAAVGITFTDGKPVVWGYRNSLPERGPGLRIVQPAQVVALNGKEVVGLVSRGTVTIPARPMGLGNLIALLARVLRVSDPTRRRRLGIAFQWILATMQALGHGGTVVIGPGNGDDWLKDVAFFRQLHLRSQAHLRRVVDVLAEQDGGSPDARVIAGVVQLAMRDEVSALFRNAGHLTSIDGALVVRDDLTVLGFGAKLTIDAADLQVKRYDMFCDEERPATPVAKLGGMRHQSAARFVARHNDCTAIVVSQDGRVTLMWWESAAKSVVAVSGLEHCAAG